MPSRGPGAPLGTHNPNYWTAARLVEVASEGPFDQYLREHVFAPLGMTNTLAVLSLEAAHDVPDGHVRLFGQPLALPEPRWFLGGCSGIVSTAEDMGRWLAFHITGAAPSGDRLVSPAGLDELHQGLGWNARTRDGRTIFTHNGILFTYSARQYLLPDVGRGVGVAVLANTGIALAPVDSDSIADALVAIVEGRSPDTVWLTGLFVDTVLASLLVAVASLGVRALRNSTRWAAARRTRSYSRNLAGQLPRLLPVALLVWYPTVVGAVAGGRDANWIQSLYISAPLFLVVAVLALTNTLVIGRRMASLKRVPAVVGREEVQ